MKIHEYQAMELFREYEISTGSCKLAHSPGEAASLSRELGPGVVVKAQVLVGGRGKAGGVKLASSSEEAEKAAGEILSMRIKSIPVDKVLIAKAEDVQKEYYLGVTIDRARKEIVIIVTGSGGVEIEELAKDDPDKILKLYIDPVGGPDKEELKSFLSKVFSDGALLDQALDTAMKLYRLFIDKDCSLVEINPYVLVGDNKLIAIDAKINFDDNGLFKHPEIEKLKNPEEYSQDEISAQLAGLSFVSLEGDIGCIVNGAGLAMATMDVIKLFGGRPANFLDVGGSSNPNKVINALRIILNNKNVKAILINIFGGITRCDDIAKGIIMATKELDIKVPLVIRLIGTNEKDGIDILKRAGITAVASMSEAVKKVTELAVGEV